MRLFFIEVQRMWAISVNLLSDDSCAWTCKCQSCLWNTFDLVQQLISVPLLKVAFIGEAIQVPLVTDLFNILMMLPYAVIVWLWYQIWTY